MRGWVANTSVSTYVPGIHAPPLIERVQCWRLHVTRTPVFDALKNIQFSNCHLETASAHNDSLIVSAADDDSIEMHIISTGAWYNVLKAEINRPTGVVKMKSGRLRMGGIGRTFHSSAI